MSANSLIRLMKSTLPLQTLQCLAHFFFTSIHAPLKNSPLWQSRDVYDLHDESDQSLTHTEGPNNKVKTR